MTDLGVLQAVRLLDATGAVALARHLIISDAGRLELPLDDFVMSGRLYLGDQGIDGRTSFPSAAETLLPAGRCVWQVKSGTTQPSATDEFAVKHVALRDEIAGGADYVLFWTSDPPHPQETAVKEAFIGAVRAVRPSAEVHFLFGPQIERLCLANLASLVEVLGLPLGGLVTVRAWRNRFVAEFMPDEPRIQLIEEIRAHIREAEPYSSTLHIYGDTGVGKSRAIFQAVDTDGVRERVLVATDPGAIDRALLSIVATTEDRRLVLVVDNFAAENNDWLQQYVAMAKGRIRLVTAANRADRLSTPNDRRYRELLPLSVAASKEIALSVGLDEGDADLVARFTEGYPRIALTLAEVIRAGDDTEFFIDRMRSQEIRPILETMLTEAEDIQYLGCLALFERLGFDDELAYESEVVCALFGLNEQTFRAVVEREVGRYVSDPGRYRQVTPLILAVWLAVRFLEERGDELAEVLKDLPDPIMTAFLNQMEGAAGHPMVEKVLGRILGDAPFVEGGLLSMREGHSRLIQVASLVNPELAAETVTKLFRGVTRDEVQSFEEGRRGLVWALELLLWFRESFQSAADALLELSLAENENWANNATGVLQGIFRVLLGGTSEPFSSRLKWADSAADKYGDASAKVILVGLRNAFEIHETRNQPSFGPRRSPVEWRPKTREELVETRKAAWDQTVSIMRRYPSLRSEGSEVLSRALWHVSEWGDSSLLDDLTQFDWSDRERVLLALPLMSEASSQVDSEAIAEILKYLVGSDTRSRAKFALSSEVWELAESLEEKKAGEPEILRQLAAELMSDLAEAVEVAKMSREGNQNTAYVLFQLMGRQMGEGDLWKTISEIRPVPERAVLGTFKGGADRLGDTWANQTLTSWLSDPDLGKLTLAAAHRLTPSEENLAPALQAVDEGMVDVADLGNLLYGAWLAELPSEALVAVLQRLRSHLDQDRVLEHALGIVNQWFDKNSDVPDEVRQLASELINETLNVRETGSSMAGYYRTAVGKRLNLTANEQLQLVLKTLKRDRTFPEEGDMKMLEELASAEPDMTVDAVIAELMGALTSGSFEPWLLWIADARLLTRLRKATSDELVVQKVLELDPQLWPQLLDHVDFVGDPDPILIALLDQGSDERLEGHAAMRFAYPESTWSGSESSRLEKRLQTIEDWMGQDLGERVNDWLSSLRQDIENQMDNALQREAERGY